MQTGWCARYRIHNSGLQGQAITSGECEDRHKSFDGWLERSEMFNSFLTWINMIYVEENKSFICCQTYKPTRFSTPRRAATSRLTDSTLSTTIIIRKMWAPIEFVSCCGTLEQRRNCRTEKPRWLRRDLRSCGDNDWGKKGEETSIVEVESPIIDGTCRNTKNGRIGKVKDGVPLKY
jgi:hypothetical protein